MFCIRCGTELAEGAKFCMQCGCPVEDLEMENPAEGNKAAENPVAKSPAGENSAAGNFGQGTSATAKPAVGNAAMGNPAAGAMAGGSPIMGAPAVGNPMAAINPMADKVKEKLRANAGNKNLFIIGGAALAFVVVLALILLFRGAGGGFSSPEKAFEAYFNGYNQEDFEQRIKAIAEFQLEDEGGKEVIMEGMKEAFETEMRTFTDAGIHFEYKATGHEKLDEDEAEDVKQVMTDAFGPDIKVSDICTVEYELTTTNDNTGDEDVSYGTGGYAYKYKGDWYFISFFH